jgi:hypothetical protein
VRRWLGRREEGGGESIRPGLGSKLRFRTEALNRPEDTYSPSKPGESVARF